MCKGKVLVIDEAYNLDDNMYGKQVLDTIVEKVSGQASEDIAVVMAGYEKEMRKMLRDQNPGLSSRFDPASAFYFNDYDDAALMRMFKRKCTRDGLYANVRVLHAAGARLSRKRDLPRFGNAREVDILVSAAQAKAISRPRPVGSKLIMLEKSDVEDPSMAAGTDALSKLDHLYKVNAIRSKIEAFKQMVKGMEDDTLGRPPVPSLIFVGNAGTGKTTVARVMAEVFSASDLDLLGRSHVEETSASALKGAVIGKAQENVEKVMKAAHGGVLFVDEAYALGDGPYGQEALDTLVGLMTKPEYKKTMVILAGYKANMTQMLTANQGARSRFTETWEFEDWSAEDCTGFVCKSSASLKVELPEPAQKELRDGFAKLATFEAKVVVDGSVVRVQQTRPGWANVRDVVTVFQQMQTARFAGLALVPKAHAFTKGSRSSQRALLQPSGLPRRERKPCPH